MPNLVRVAVLVSGWIGRAHDRWRARVARRFSLRAEIDALHETIRRALTEAQLLRARFERLDSHRRPMYLPQERLEILAHAERYGLSIQAICRAFLVSDQTVLNWRAELGLDKSRVVRGDPPIHRLPDLVCHIAARLKREWPAWGTRRIALIPPPCSPTSKPILASSGTSITAPIG